MVVDLISLFLVFFNLISKILTRLLNSGLAVTVRVCVPEIGWVDEVVERKDCKEVDARKEEQQGLVNGCHKFEPGSRICLRGGYWTHMFTSGGNLLEIQVLSDCD